METSGGQFLMIFTDIATGSVVFLDANAFIYHFMADPAFGTASNDALTVVVMQRHGLTLLASNDADFDRVPGTTRYAPI